MFRVIMVSVFVKFIANLKTQHIKSGDKYIGMDLFSRKSSVIEATRPPRRVKGPFEGSSHFM